MALALALGFTSWFVSPIVSLESSLFSTNLPNNKFTAAIVYAICSLLTWPSLLFSNIVEFSFVTSMGVLSTYVQLQVRTPYTF